MTKEELLKKLQDSILTLIQKSSELLTYASLKQKWIKNNNEIREAFKQLNSCDANWLNDEYGKWFKSNADVQKAMKERKDYLKQHLDWV